jgi:electron transfer flavoprotein alpha subunit
LPAPGAGPLSVLVFLEHHGEALQKGSLGVLGKAASLGDPDVAAVLVGAGARSLAAEAGRFGAAKVYVADDASLDPPLPQPRVDVLAQVVTEGDYDAVLFANSVLAADVAAGLAARLEAGVNWDLVDLQRRDGELVGTRPALGDSVYVDVGWRSPTRLALFRAGSFDPTPSGTGEPEVVEVTPQLAEHSTRARVVEQQLEQASGPSIEDAEVVVAGGRGLGAPEHFTLAEELAKALGGAVGATRAVVDAGWYPYSTQIGQTGKTVSPKLYVALGISGAIQHKVGMQSSNVIVAINKDPNAPIFDFSDLGVVGDVHDVVPKLIELIRARAS